MLFGIEHAPDSNGYERYAEQLPHVQQHALLEVHLFFLQKLDEEAEGEDGCEAEAKVEACANR